MGVGRQLLDEGVSAAPVPWNGGHHDGLRRRCRLVVRRPWSRANCLRCSPRVAPCSATFVHGRGAPPRPLGLASLLLGPQVAAADGPLDLEPAAAGRVEEAGLVWAQEVVQSLGLHEDDEAEAAMLVGVMPCAGPGAVLLQPGLLDGGVLGEDGVEPVLGHVLGNASHEDLAALRRNAPGGAVLRALLALPRVPLGAPGAGLLWQSRRVARRGRGSGAPRWRCRPEGGGGSGADGASRAAVWAALHLKAP
mmetsp:Transcript_40039/g.118734  ORF Transcript_40039/g.118734 Transcript_40039/m.118734 type:complete len:250 (-) Transcript_40039:340-1089(-)